MFTELIFLSPWVLSALAAIPALWWMLKVMPPRAKTVVFSAFFLLKGIHTDVKSAAHTPWWLLLLRSLMMIFFIIAFAEPVWHPAQKLPGGTTGNVLMVVDNGWASVSHWQERQEKMKEHLRQIRRSGRPVLFLPTAPSDEDGRMHVYGPVSAAETEAWISRIKPQPWMASYTEAAALVQKARSDYKITYSVFFSDGLAVPAELLSSMQTLVTDDKVNSPYILRSDPQKSARDGFALERLKPSSENQNLQILAVSEEGNILDTLKIEFPAGETDYAFAWNMLPEVRHKTARLSLREAGMASATYLVNAQWRQHPVGIVANKEQRDSRDFLNEVYYLRRALEAGSQITMDRLDTLLEGHFSALILPDTTPLTASEKEALRDWVRQGGFLIRFAGPNLSSHADDDILLPVPLRDGQRTMAGAMTWGKPMHLGPIPESSPLYGLTVPEDVTVTRQLLAEPAPDVFEKMWLQLEDGTPLITGAGLGQGTVVLVHTSAGPEWSSFCYSGLYVEALQRMVALSNGIHDYKAQTVLVPLALLDGFGQVRAPDAKAIVTPISPGQAFDASPQTPPGVYGSAQEFQAFNLGDALPGMQALKDIPADTHVAPYQKVQEAELKPLFLKLAVLLLLAETLVTFWLRGMIVFSAAVLASLIFVTPAVAAPEERDLVTGLYLGYIETGDRDIDRISYNGLTGLGEVVSTRTTAKIQGVSALNPESGLLSYYPFIYWPMAAQQQALSAKALRNIQNYLSTGGFILIDTRDSQFGADQGASTPGTRRLRELTQNIQIPELMRVPKDHILTRSFYLLDDFPGRYAGGSVWVEKEPNPHHDAVTSVVIGANDWAAAWSRDKQDQARYNVEPGGEIQREMSYRFGVNLLITALTGNYKADQVHVPHILERLGK